MQKLRCDFLDVLYLSVSPLFSIRAVGSGAAAVCLLWVSFVTLIDNTEFKYSHILLCPYGAVLNQNDLSVARWNSELHWIKYEG